MTEIEAELLRHRQFDNNTLENNLFVKDVVQVQLQNNECKTAKPTLLQWNDMPKHLQFNPYIKTGYRPLLNVRGCFNSLFYFHNETVNIVTHGKNLGAILQVDFLLYILVV